jgi:hypothetical protein
MTTTTMTISGADVTTPAEAETFLGNLATAYGQLVAALDQFISNQTADGVTGEPLEFLGAMQEQAAIMSRAMTTGAARAAEHRTKFGDTWANDPSLAGTQSGGYGDAERL